MRQFTDISVSKWEDPRASALTSYCISSSQAKTSRYTRVLGSAPFKQRYEICDDDDDDDEEESSDSSEDDNNSADAQPTEEAQKQTVLEDGTESKTGEPTTEEASASAKESEESNQEEKIAEKPAGDDKVSKDNGETLEKPPTKTDDNQRDVEDASFKNRAKKEDQNVSQDATAEGSDASTAVPAANEEESEGSMATEEAKLNESGTREPVELTSATSNAIQEDRVKAENGTEITADDKHEVESPDSSDNEKDTKSPIEVTETPNDNVTQEAEVAAETSTSKIEDVKTEHSESESIKLENKALETVNIFESQPDSASVELSAKNISFAANVKDPKPGIKSSKSKKKKILGKKKDPSVNNSAPKTKEEATTAATATASDSSNVKPEPAPKESKVKYCAGEEAASVVAKSTAKVSERKKSLLGKQLKKNEKKSNKKKGNSNNDDDKTIEGKATDTTQEESNTVDAPSFAVDGSQPIDQSGEDNTNNGKSEKNDEVSNAQENSELADREGGEESVVQTIQEDDTPDEKADKLDTVDIADGEGEAACGEFTKKSEDATVENDKDMDAEKLSVVAEPSSEKNGKPDPNNAEFGDEIDEKGPGQDEANENTVIESDEIDNDLTRSIQETGHEDNDQIVDKAVVETAINYLASSNGDTPEALSSLATEAKTAKPEPVDQNQSDLDEAKAICEAKPTSTPRKKLSNGKKSSKKDKSRRKISSADLTPTVKDRQIGSHTVQEEGLKDNSISYDGADGKKAKSPVKGESVKEIEADTDNCKTVESPASEPSPNKDELPDDIANAVAVNNSQDEKHLPSRTSMNDVSTSEDKSTETLENGESAVTKTDLATKDVRLRDNVTEIEKRRNDVGDIEVSNEGNSSTNVTDAKLRVKATEEKIGEELEFGASCTEKEPRKENPVVNSPVEKDISEVVESDDQPAEEVADIQDSSAEKQSLPIEASRNDMNAAKDEDVHEEKLKEDDPKPKNQAPTEEDNLIEENLDTNIESSKEKEKIPIERREKSAEQPKDENLAEISIIKEAEIEVIISDGLDKTVQNIVPSDENTENLENIASEKLQEGQLSLNKVEAENEVSAAEANNSFVVESKSDFGPDDKKSEINEVKTNIANPMDLLDCSSNADDMHEKDDGDSQLDNYTEVITLCKRSDNEKVDHENIDIVKDTKEMNDYMKYNQDISDSGGQVEEVEIFPKTELRTNNPEMTFENSDNKAGEDSGESKSRENSPANMSNGAKAEPQKEAADTRIAASQIENPIDEDIPTQTTEMDKLTASNERDVESENLETDNVKFNTESASPDPYVERSTGPNTKRKKRGQDSSRKPRRSSGGSFLSMNANSKPRRDSHGSKPTTDKRKSKPKSDENEKDREEKRKRREAKKDEEIRFLRRELARYEERQKHDQAERRHKRELKKRIENNSLKATKRSSHDVEGDRTYVQSDDQKNEKRRERTSIDENFHERKQKDETTASIEGKNNDISPLKGSNELKSSKEKLEMRAEKQAVRSSSNQHHRRHSESYRGYKESRPRPSRPLDTSLKEKKTLNSSSFDDKVIMATGVRSPPLPPILADMSSSANIDKDPSRDREIRRSRRASYKPSLRDKRKNSFHGKDKEDVSILAAGKSLFSGIRNALAKA